MNDLQPGEHVRIVIAAEVISQDRHMAQIDYMGTQLSVSTSAITACNIARHDLVQITLDVTVVRRTGKASFLCQYIGLYNSRWYLPMPEQCIKCRIEENAHV